MAICLGFPTKILDAEIWPPGVETMMNKHKMTGVPKLLEIMEVGGGAEKSKK